MTDARTVMAALKRIEQRQEATLRGLHEVREVLEACLARREAQDRKLHRLGNAVADLATELVAETRTEG